MTNKYCVNFLVLAALFVFVPAGNADTLEVSLKKSMDLAVANSSQLQAEKTKEKAAALNSRNVELNWLPDLLVGATYKYEEGGDDSGSNLSPFLTLSQVVYNNPRSYSERIEAMSKTVAVKTAQVEILSDLYTGIIEKYFSLIQAQSSAQLMAEYVKGLEEEFKRSAKMSQKGLISPLELMQNESFFEMAKIENDVEQDKVRLASFDLADQMGVDVEQMIRATDSFTPSFYSIDFEKCREYARTHHPMFQLNRIITDNLPEFRKKINLMSWPTLTVTGYLGSGANEWSSDSDYSVSVSLSKSLWDFGKTGRRKEILTIELNVMENDINRSEEKYFVQLKKLYSEYENSAKMLHKMTEYQALAEKLNAATEKNYRMGLISHQDLLKAKKKDIGRKVEYLSLSNRYLVSEMLLKLYCGVFDSELLLQHGSGWLEISSNETSPETPE